MELTLQNALATRRAPSQRLFFIDVPPKRTLGFAESVATGLSKEKKSLCCRFLYDQVGSRLFEQITELPEYYLTKCEESILARRAGEILGLVGKEVSIVELGSGSSAKTRHLIRAGLKRQHTLLYSPIDISGDFLRECAADLVRQFDGLLVSAVAGEYLDALRALAPTNEPRLFVFLGSNLGNFENAQALELLVRVAQAMKPTDRFLVGIDLAKDASIIEPAYNDSQGVTARFNKNILARINRELHGKFDLKTFTHKAKYVPSRGRVEIELVSQQDQSVAIGHTSYDFEKGEPILTEVSTKYTLPGFERLAYGAGLGIQSVWHDAKRYFAVALLQPVS
jgi:dimethylhistidine N-methyltransferase